MEAECSAANGKEMRAVSRSTTICTLALDAKRSPTELASALAHRRLHPQTPYKPAAWSKALQQADLLKRFDMIPAGLRLGFCVGYPIVTRVQNPPNSTSISLYAPKFDEIVHKEIFKGRYIGPFPFPILESILGPFQSSPLSLIPKLGRPDKFRLIQNFSFPLSPSPQFPNASINQAITSELIPCTWGKFSTIYLLVSRLPLGSQAATRDIAEAYRTIPLHPSHWPAAIVRISDSHACIDTCAAFGASPSCGAYGQLADAGAEILRANDIGPLDKWVDDHIFFRIPLTQLQNYNRDRRGWHNEINQTGMRHTGSRIWYSGVSHEGGTLEEFSEDCFFPIKDLSTTSNRPIEDMAFTYGIVDIDRVSFELGIPWECSKDQPFASTTIYIGFLWDLDAHTVELSPSKIGKYANAIDEWLARLKHTLKNVQELYGKLLHAASLRTQGRAYLVGLESMLTTCAKRPFVPHRPNTGIEEDLKWWQKKILSGALIRPIFPPPPFVDLEAFSDASSGVGIGIVIRGRWRAWRLLPGWKTTNGQRDIGWAEALGFELLIRTIDLILVDKQHVKVYGDNTGVIEGWHVGRHRNAAVNSIFREIHSFLETTERILSVIPHYVPSANNPADPPSRGTYGPEHLFLPHFPIPEHAREFIVDATTPLSARELRALREGYYSGAATKVMDRLRIRQESAERIRAEAGLEDEFLFNFPQNH